MAAKTEGAQVSLRPMSLRPGGGSSKNPFERFAKGAGYAVKAKAVDSQPYEEEKRKPRSEIKIYTKEEIEALQELNVKAPTELENFPELQINSIEAQRPIQTDDRDWRGRAEQPAGSQDWQKRQNNASSGGVPGKDDGKSKGEQRGAAQSRAPAAAETSQAAPLNPETLKMQRAEDLGRTAWQKGATQEGNKRTLKEVKGILNKLTPEKFDTLSRQLLQLVTNTEVLQGTITLIFENAVAQPTFVAVYANLCDSLAKALPESLTGGDRSQSFKRILLNTCQEEFEGAAEARTKLASAPEEDRADLDRKVKMRTLGNIRLIAELFNKGMVAEKIVIVCIEELIGGAPADPVEDNIEALCELMTNAGKKLDATTKSKPKFESFFTTLDKLSKSKKLPPRIRFMIRDVLDLRKSTWIPRRDVLQAKKIEEIHAEAHAELGMVPTPALPLLQSLPALPVVGRANQDIELFPAFRGGDAGWEASGKLKGHITVEGKQQSSAFFLDVDPLVEPSAAASRGSGAAPAGPSTAAAPSKREPLKNLSEDERESRAKSLFSEWISSRDYKEATACVQELSAPGFLPKLVSVGVERMLDAMQAREQEAVADLLARLVSDDSVSKTEFLEGLHKHLDALDDLRIDVPIAPKAIGYLVGLAIAEGVSELKELPELLSKVEEAESKRLIGAAIFKTIKEKVGEEKLQELGKNAKLDAEKLFAADPELDSPDLPNVAAFLKAEGLQSVLA